MARILTALFVLTLLCISNLNAQQSPYNGNPWTIPGIIEAENYDLGGEEVGYHDLDTTNQGGEYRGEGVDIENCADGGFNVGWVSAGEWIEYTVHVTAAGKYKLRLRVAAPSTGGQAHVEFNGVNVTGTLDIPATGDWQQWAWLDLSQVQLDSGLQVMRFTIDNTGYNISFFQFIKEIDTQYPTCLLISPQDSSEFETGEEIMLEAQSADSDGTIQKVDFLHDGMLINSDIVSPYAVAWKPDGPGMYHVYAVATDNAGATTESNSVYVIVLAAQLTSKPDFSVEHGFYASPFDLTVSCDSANATIRYTLDGSDPRNNPSAFEKPSPVIIHIDPDDTTGRGGATPAVVVRAFAKVNDVPVTDAGAQTYIFTDRVKSQKYPGGKWPVGPVNTKILDYEMDPDVVNDARYKDLIDDALLEIPSVCINTDLKNLFDPQTGIYVNPTGRGIEWERPASIELIDPHGKEPGFQINAGLRLRGGYSRIPAFQSGQYKHALRFFFRKEYGKGKLDYPLFGNEGVTKFDGVDLRTAQNYSWSYQSYSSHVCIFVRELFSRDSQRDMGEPYTRSRNYHLYINGMYWGLYQTQERSEASYAESYFGGDKSNYDVVKVDPTNGQAIEATDGTLEMYNQFWSQASSGFSSNTNYFKAQGRNIDGTPNLQYPALLNVENFIDYMLIIFYTGNFDAPVSAFMGNTGPNNFYGIYNRLGRTGFLFFAHDAEHSLMDQNYSENSDYGLNRTGPYYGGSVISASYFNPQWLHERLSANAEYKVAFSDRIYEHFFNNGALTPQKSQQRLSARTSEIDTAVIAESARWGDAKVNPPRTKDDDWLPSVQWILNSYFPTRTNVVLQQLKNDNLYPSIDPPVIMSGAQEIQDAVLALQTGDTIRLINGNASQTGTVFYTLDGHDPRSIGGAASPSAFNGGDQTAMAITANTVLKARVQNGSVWSALHQIVLNTGTDLSGLRITELHYNPLPDGEVDGSEFEFIEFKNVGLSSVSLAGALFAEGVEYTFPDEAIVAPGSFVVLASNAGMFQQRYGFAPGGEYNQQLDNSGERITMVDGSGDTLFSVRYNDKTPWPVEADGIGNSLAAKSTNGLGIPDSADYWRASLNIHGSPGSDDIPTSVEEPSTIAPADFALYQNYPNPFNPVTMISYSLRKKGNATLSVYDMLGRKVTVLVDGIQEEGYHRVSFAGSTLSSGIYFYRLQSAEGNVVRKMMLLK